MISDEELDAMIAMQGTMAISAAIEQLPIASERHKKTCEALTELLALRRRDAAIEKAQRIIKDGKGDVEFTFGDADEEGFFAYAYNREKEETLGALTHNSILEALSALAAGLAGESR